MSRNKTKASDAVDQAESESVVQESTPVEATSAAPSPIKNDASTKSAAVHRVRAADYFFDARLGRDFHAGQEVVGWDEERVREYAKRGLIVVDTVVGPTEFK